ncbi:hypothetical protein [Cohnella nanjingensis]|nr:hypothetical protein [Cohnella nanjingensis]
MLTSIYALEKITQSLQAEWTSLAQQPASAKKSSARLAKRSRP